MRIRFGTRLPTERHGRALLDSVNNSLRRW